MAFLYSFHAIFDDGSGFDQSPDDDGPSSSSFRELAAILRSGAKRLSAFVLEGPGGRQIGVDAVDGHFEIDGAPVAPGHALPSGFEWAKDIGCPAVTRLIYYRIHTPDSTVWGPQQPPATQFCVGWEANGKRNILGVSP